MRPIALTVTFIKANPKYTEDDIEKMYSKNDSTSIYLIKLSVPGDRGNESPDLQWLQIDQRSHSFLHLLITFWLAAVFCFLKHFGFWPAGVSVLQIFSIESRSFGIHWLVGC